MISREDIDSVREATDIVALLHERGTELRQVGTRHVGLCPFHNEKTPSFNVNPVIKTFVCFGCGEKGDVFRLISEMDGLPFMDTLRQLAERYSIELKEPDHKEEQDQSSRRRLLAVVKDAAQWYRDQFEELSLDHPAKLELSKRNLLEVEGRPTWLEDFGVGYAPEGWNRLSQYLQRKEYSTDEIIAAGLATMSEKSHKLVDRYRGRLTWEIRDIQGRPIGFGARKLFDSDDGGKYLNSPQGLLYDKSKVLYGLDMARRSITKLKEVNVVEGYTDVMAMHAAGIENVVASSGTAFDEQHANALRRLIDDYDDNRRGRFVFGFDSDKAGQEAARKTFALRAPIHTRAFVVKGEGDPCDIRLAEGDEALRKVFSPENRTPLTDFVLRNELGNHDIATGEGRSSFLRVAVPMLSVITDNGLRDDYARKVAFWSATGIDTVKDALRITERYDPDETPPDTSSTPPPDEEDPFGDPVIEQRSSLWNHEYTVLALLFQYPRAAYTGVEKSGIDESHFPDSDLMYSFVEISSLLSLLTKMPEDIVLRPQDFSNEALAIDLFHHRLPVVEKMYNKAGGDEFVTKTTERFANALRNIPRHESQKALQARVSIAFSDRNTEDESALQDILDAQAKLRRPRRKTRMSK